MNTAVNEYNYRFKLTDYSLFDRNRARKVAIYGRVSTEHEAQLSALENQLQWYDDQVRYHSNWTVYDRYIDEGITGTQAKKRPAFLRMLDDARKGKFDLIVTREVCRFARNVVDTLVVTRELKGIGVEVYFIDDNIWTMDGDGELRLSLMATLAQEESRKTSERVKAGQKISRDNGVLYGNGNILGYDRVGDTYVINEEQAETVRMIFDLYLQGYGSMKIAKILTERKRKTASGLIKWSVSNIMRAIKNATYTGTKCYNKSRSNNFLEQKRINNLDMSTYEYVEGDFPAIVSQEIWDKAQAIRESRVKPALVTAEKTTHSKRDSRDIWVNKLRCSCGSSYRKNKWHTKLDGKTSYGYQCYNQLNNGIKRKRAEIGLDTEGYCDSRMITDWKLDFMAKALLEHLWQERKESVLIALDLIKHYYKEERATENKSDAVSIQARIDKANSRLTNLIAMRADGEISKDEYQSMRSPIDAEIKELQKALDDTPTEKCSPRGLDLEGIRSTLNSLIDFSGSTISHDVVNQFVYMVTPTSDTTFDWYVNLNGTADVKATFTAEGRKKSCIIKLEEIEKISSLHRKENEDNAHLIKNPIVFTFLHRQRSAQRRTENRINQNKKEFPVSDDAGSFLVHFVLPTRRRSSDTRVLQKNVAFRKKLLLFSFGCVNISLNRSTPSERSSRRMFQTEIAVLIPAYKPSAELSKVCVSMLEAGFTHVVVVDDGGGEEFRPVFDALPEQVTRLHHEVNRGKGRALKTGMEYIRDHFPDCKGIVTCDADGQHLARDILNTAKALAFHEGDALILGSRLFDKDVPFRSRVGNDITRWVYRLASHVPVRDTQTGLRAFSMNLVPLYISLEGERYEFEINMLLYTARAHIPIVEVDIETVYLDENNSSSHFRAVRDSAIIYGKILKFSMSSLLCFLIDFVLLFVFKALLQTDLFSAMSAELRLLAAVVAARAVSSTVNYLLNRKVVFRSRSKNTFIKYVLLVLFILGANYGLLWLLSEFGPLPLFWAKLLTEFVLYFVSFNVQKHLIFRDRNPQN